MLINLIISFYAVSLCVAKYRSLRTVQISVKIMIVEATGVCGMRDLGTVLSFLAASLQGKVNDGRPPPESERQKLIDTMQAVFEQSSSDDLAAGSMMNPLGFAVLALLGSLVPSLSVSIRVSAIQALLCLMEKIKEHHAVLYLLLPAACSLMSKIVGNVEKEPHQLTVSAVMILQILLTCGLPSNEKIPLAMEQNLGAILLIVLKAAKTTKDSRVLDALQQFTKAINDQISLEPLTHLILQLACTTKVELSLRESQFGAANGLYLSTKAKAEDANNPIESRIESLKFVAYLEALLSQEDKGKTMELVVDLVSEQIDAERSKKSNAVVAVASLPNLLQCCAPNSIKLPQIFGPNIDSVLAAFDQICSNADPRSTMDSLMVFKDRSPETCLLLLGRSLRSSENPPEKAEMVIDSGLQIITESDRLTSCAFMHLLVDVSAVLGGEKFDQYWRYTMMDVLTWLASPDTTVSSYAASALQLISQSYERRTSPIDLIKRHLDYVVDQLGLQIRCPTVYPLAPRILTALLSVIGPSFTCCITDILGGVLENLQAYRSHDGYVYELLGVISASAKSLVPRQKRVDIPRGEEEESAGLSVEQKTAEQMINVVVHFILSDRRKIRLRSLQTLSDLAMAFETNCEAFLPLVHLTWPAVLSRVSESDPFVAGQALRTIADMASIAGDFMQSRVNQELWPVLKGPTHLIGPVMECFSRLALLMTLSLKTVQGLCNMMVDALRIDSPQALKEAAILLGESLAKTSPDALWFVLVCQVDQSQSSIEGVDTRPYKTLAVSQFNQLSKSHLHHLLSLIV